MSSALNDDDTKFTTSSNNFLPNNDATNNVKLNQEKAKTKSSPPKIFLLVSNPRKTNNLGPILRCAVAFGVAQVIAVGFAKCDVNGSHGASKHIEIINFPTIEQAIRYLRRPQIGKEKEDDVNENEDTGCECQSIIGLLGGFPENTSATAGEPESYDVYEDDKNTALVQVQESNDLGKTKTNTSLNDKKSYPAHTEPFAEGNCCFVISNSIKGLPLSFAEYCDRFIHISHENFLVGQDGCEDLLMPSLLDVPSCLSIVLYHYTNWANYNQRDFTGHKYVKLPMNKNNSNNDSIIQDKKKLNRIIEKEKREKAANETISTLETMFNEEEQQSQGDY